MLSFMFLVAYLYSMKKLFILICIFLTSMSISYADTQTCISNADGSMPTATDFLKRCAAGTVWVSPLEWSDKVWVQNRVAVIAESAIGLWAIFAIAFLVWAGIQYTTAYGDDEKLKHAKSTGIYALAWLILLMLAFGLVDIFLRFIYGFV